jgi:regulatory protein
VIPKQGRKELLSILIDGEEWKTIHTAIFGKNPSFPLCSSEMEWKQLFEKIESERVKNYALRRLSAQNYHSAQLTKLLKERLVTNAVIAKTIREFQAKGYLNDQDWIRSFVRSQRKRLGLSAILKKLYAKGVSSEEIQQVKETYQNSEEDYLNIQNLIKTKYRSKNIKLPKERQKIIASLVRKGFNFDQIINVFETLNY